MDSSTEEMEKAELISLIGEVAIKWTYVEINIKRITGVILFGDAHRGVNCFFDVHAKMMFDIFKRSYYAKIKTQKYDDVISKVFYGLTKLYEARNKIVHSGWLYNADAGVATILIGNKAKGKNKLDERSISGNLVVKIIGTDYLRDAVDLLDIAKILTEKLEVLVGVEIENNAH